MVHKYGALVIFPLAMQQHSEDSKACHKHWIVRMKRVNEEADERGEHEPVIKSVKKVVVISICH